MTEEENEEENEPRMIGLYGEIDDENSKELVGALLGYIHETKNASKEPEPVELIISTGGGQLADMFAIYDLMRLLRERCHLNTLGIGKVMSAGILLLAAGTKGSRCISKHCRIMFHHVMTSEQGSVADVASTYKEATIMEQMMLDVLAEETDMSVKELRNLLKTNTDKFFSAEEAVKMGIADIIV